MYKLFSRLNVLAAGCLNRINDRYRGGPNPAYQKNIDQDPSNRAGSPLLKTNQRIALLSLHREQFNNIS